MASSSSSSSSVAAFSIANARSRFPALKQEQVFMDNAGGSQVLDTVIESITEYLTKTNVQLGATYKTSKISTALYNEGYKAAADFVNARPNEICIGVSTTQLLHNLSTSLSFQPGDEIILSVLNHEANSAPWVRAAESRGLQVKWWTPRDRKNPVCDVETLKPLLSKQTRLVACPHVSNLTGGITRVREVADLVHEFPRAMLCVDGVALAPHRQVDVHELGVDFYAFSWYKVYGPHIAQLYASSRIHEQLRSLAHYFKLEALSSSAYGSGSAPGSGSESPTPSLDLTLNLASANYELTQSLPRIVEYFGANPRETWAAIAAHEEALQEILLRYLRSHPKITVVGEDAADQHLRVPVISFLVEGMKSQEVVEAVEARSNFGFRSGHMYSHRLVRDVLRLKDLEDGVVRVSLLHYNTEEEVKGLVKVLQEVIGN